MATIGTAMFTAVTACIMYCSLREMKRQSIYGQLIRYEEGYNGVLFHVAELRNNGKGHHQRKMLPYYFQLLTHLNSACRIALRWHNDKDIHVFLLKFLIKKIKIFMERIEEGKTEYEYLTKPKYPTNGFDCLEKQELEEYYKSIKK